MSNLATITNNILADSGIDDINVIVSTGSYANPAWITSLAWTKITGTPSGIVTGSGTTNTIPKFTGASTIGNSNITDNGTNVAIASTATIFGNTGIGNITASELGGRLNVRNEDAANNPTLVLFKNIGFTSTEDILRVQSFQNGVGIVTTASIRANGSANFSGSITATSIIRSGGTSSQYLMADGSVSTLSNPVTGTGTTNYLPKFTGSTTIGNSQIIDNGTQVGIGLNPNTSYGTLQIKAPSGVYSLDLIGRTAGLNSESQISFWNAAQSSVLAYITNTGSNLYLGTAANQPFTLSSGGNFIFGTTSDNGARLQVSGTATVSGSLTANGNLFLANDGTYGSSYITLGFGGTSNGSNRIFAGTSSSVDGIFIAAATGRPISFRAGGGTTDNLIIASTGAATFSGNLGVNGSPANSFPLEAYINSSTAYTTSSRGNVFRVYNSNTAANIFAGIELGGAGTANDGLAGINGVVTGSGSGALTFYTRDSNTFSEKVRITSSGNVGIGTPTPSCLFQARGSDSLSANSRNLKAHIGGAGTWGSNSFEELGVGYSGIRSTYTSGDNWDLSFSTGTSTTFVAGTQPERMRITSGGYLKLHQSRFLGDSDICYIDLYNPNTGNLSIVNTSTNALYGSIILSTNNAPRMNITLGGNVLIGTTTDNGERLQVNGTSTISGNLVLTNGVNRILRIGSSTSYYYDLQTVGDNFQIREAGSTPRLTFTYPTGAVTFSNLAGSGNRIVVANSSGTLISAVIGSGLAFDGTTLTATGGGSGSISGSGTAGFMPVFTGATSIGNSIIQANASRITVVSNTDGQLIEMARSGGAYYWKLGIDGSSRYVLYNNSNTSMFEIDPNNANTTFGSGQNVTLRLGRNPNDWGEVQYSGGATTLRNGWDNTNGYVQQLVNGQWTRLFGSGLIDQNRTSEGTFYRLLVNGNGRMTLGTDGSANAIIRTGNNVDLRLGVNEDAITIKNGGNVLIGTTTDFGWRLVVDGNIYLPQGANRQIFIGSATAYNYRLRTDNDDFVITEAGVTDRLRYSYSSVRWTISAATTCTSSITATAFFESSDSKIKILLEDKLDYQAIANVTAKYYEKNGKVELGYFAQDFETLLPNAVSKNEDGLLNLSYREVHTAKIAYLEERIKQLEKKYENN